MHYLIQVNLYLILFVAFYWLFLRKETFYQANRFYLLFAAILSFVIPFMYTEKVQSWFVTKEISDLIFSYDASAMKEPLFAVSSAVEGTRISLTDILLFIYVSGVLFFTIKFGLKVFRTFKFLSKFEIDSEQAFTFFGKIRIGKALAHNRAVLEHERVHVKQCHSLDVIVFEVVTILCWFNPVVYFLRKEIELLHEFQADEVAYKIIDSKSKYAALLVSQKFGITPDAILGNYFMSQSLLKLRIKMLTKEESDSQALVKYGFVAPLFLGMMVLASASIAKSGNLDKIEQLSDRIVFKPSLDLKQVSIDLSEYTKGGIVKSLGDDEDLRFGQLVPPPPPVEQPQKIVVEKKVLTEKGEEVVEIAYVETIESEIFIGVEESPSFKGGEGELRAFLKNNAKYPEEAAKANIQGRVTVQFVVEKDGSISSIKVLKGLGFGLDEEARRVVGSMPAWNPGVQNGRPVRVFYTIPIVFTLE